LAHPDVYAGDLLTHGHLYVGFIGDPAEHLAELLRLVARPELLRAFEATYTVMQLRSVMNRVTADSEQLQHGGIQLRSWAVDNDRNRVSVGLARLEANATWIITLRERDGGDLLTFFQASTAVPV